MDGQVQDKPVVPWKRKPRRWRWVLLGIVLVIILALVLAPIYLSSDSFRQMIQAKISRSTGGKLDIGDLSVGWLKGVQVSDLSFRESAGWARVSVKAFDAQPRLGALLGGTLSLGQTVIDRPQIEIDLRKRPPAAPAAQPRPAPESTGLNLLADVTVNDGSVSLTDLQGKTVRIENINSELNLRPRGQASSGQVDMVVADAGEEARISATGTVQSTGWTLKGTSGDVAVEVNDLNLDSLTAVFELAGIDLEAKGRLSADIKGAMLDGTVQNVTATVKGQGLDISGAPLKGDRLQTSQLNVNAKLTRQGQAIRIEQLDARTDWASVNGTGTVPTTVTSLTDLLKSDSAYDLKGDFDCDLAALLSQIPNTLGLKPGMQITAGRASGSVSTTTSSGRATIVADTKIVDLAGEVDGKELKLSAPVTANVKLSADEAKAQLESLNVSAAFAKITASGDFEQIKYDGTVNLSGLQSELGQFASLGPYQMAGDVASSGQVSIADDKITATGTLSAQQIVLASVDGNSVSEPAADIEFALGVDQAEHVLTIDTANVKASFGNVTVANATVPLGQVSTTALKADVTAGNLDLAKAKSYAVLFASFPKNMSLAGVARAQLAITGEGDKYRIHTEDTEIQDFKLVAPGKEPFAQKQMTMSCDVQLDTRDKSINVERLLLESPQIRITKGEFKKTSKADENQIQGSLQGECDWAAVGQAASVFLPEGLVLAGKRQIAVDFTSTYPANEPNMLMANLNGTASTGFDSASYMGLNVGPTNMDVHIENGLMQIAPLTTTVNNGQLDFVAQADFREPRPVLRTPRPLMLAQGIQINREMTSKLLQYVNPIFANVTGVSGIANFECQKLAIPLAGGTENQVEVVGTISASDILVEASGLLNQILTAMGQRTHGDKLTIQPTNIVLQNGVVHYDNMEVDIGENPVTFSGTIGLDERLNMTVTLPWTMQGRTVRIGREQQGQRIEVPLKGTISRPELDLERLLQNQLLRGLEGLFNR